MVKLSVSQAARQLGISRGDIQNQINLGKLQTHEGYVTTDSIRLAYPSHGLSSEQDRHIQKMQQIKDDAMFKAGAADKVKLENEQALMNAIANVKSELYKEKIKNEHYAMVFEELGDRLSELEKCCHAQDKRPLNQLQNWVKQQAN